MVNKLFRNNQGANARTESGSRLLQQVSDTGTYKVLGRLSVDSVAAYQAQGFEALQRSVDSLVFDFKEAEVVGTSVVALLISWQRRAYQLDKTLLISNPPQQLLEMAEVSGVRDIISFAPKQL
ncbi:MAG: STAS domain-containing protein [Pseudomonadales bacterium]|nr:STAS domain-containing protein [Pseudomonadales bacterium]